MGKSVMIFGLGHIGGWVLELLARCQGVGTIITAVGHGEDYGRLKTSCAAIGAAQQGYFKRFEFHKVDVNDVDQTAELLKSIQPDVIYSALALGHAPQTLFQPLPIDLQHKLWNEAGFGPWLPFSLVLVSKLMRAVKKSGITAPVLNSSFPDVVNPVLWRNNLGLTTGIGNVDNVAGEVRKKVSDAEGVPIGEVTVCYVAPHAVAAHGPWAGQPFFLKIMVRDKNVTSKFDVHSLVTERLTPRHVPPDMLESISSLASAPRTASSAVKHIMAIINDTNEYAHSPGPNGLPGGYPVRLSAKGVEVVLPEELTLEEAIRINNEAQKWDGVEEIKDDGTVVYTEKSYKIMKEMLGYDCREVRFEDMEERAKELRLVAKRIVDKYKA